MKLKLQIGDEDSQRFDSGLVSGGSSAQAAASASRDELRRVIQTALRA